MLKGKNIVLRPLQNSDLDFLFEIENNTENWQFGSEQKQYNKQELLDYIGNAKTDITLAKQFRFVIDLESIPIGFIDLFDYTANSTGIGVIITKDYRDKGLAKEALNLLTDYAFIILNIKQLHATVTKDNLASIKLFTSCGFELNSKKNDMRYFTLKDE